ncbi:MAG TPA: DivIVA domain-containing protein [Acidimicrobiales bacterium]|nr:DivIVA domain-containing protein [Acidimicrobiales bacterium]
MSTTHDFEIDYDQAEPDTGPVPVVAAPPAPDQGSATARIRSAQFREKLRGYHPDDVDSFLEQLALIVEGLEAQLADARGRMEEAERRLAVATAGEQTVRRTLVLAQRTAELAVTEAQSRAEAILAEAEAEAQARVAAVEDECLAVREREEGRLRAEIERLETAQAEAERRLEELEARRAEEHARLTEALGELAAVVEARLTP